MSDAAAAAAEATSPIIISNHTIVHVTTSHAHSSGDDPDTEVFVLDSAATLRRMLHKGLVKHAGKGNCAIFNRNPEGRIDSWLLQFIESGSLKMWFHPGGHGRWASIDCKAATLKVKGCIVRDADVEQLLLTRIDELFRL